MKCSEAVMGGILPLLWILKSCMWKEVLLASCLPCTSICSSRHCLVEPEEQPVSVEVCSLFRSRVCPGW